MMSVPAASSSAREMTQWFQPAVYGISLLSTEEKLITRQEVYDAAKKVVTQARNDRKKKKTNPVIMFYFCGHGLSEGLGWNLYLMPGDFVANPETKDATQMAELTIHAGELYDELTKDHTFPVVALFDCCYEGSDKKLDLQNFAYQESLLKVAELANTVADVLRVMNQFKEKNAVVFSAAPGTLAETVPSPLNETENVGPLCRRTMLLAKQPSPVSWKQWIDTLQSATLDSQTAPAITFWEGHEKQNQLIRE